MDCYPHAGLMIMDNEMWNSVEFDDLQAALKEVLHLKRLTSFDFVVNIEREPNFKAILFDFYRALALDESRCKEVRYIHGYIHAIASGFYNEGDEEAMEQRASRIEQANNLKQEWSQVSASLQGKKREVSFSVGGAHAL